MITVRNELNTIMNTKTMQLETPLFPYNPENIRFAGV